MASLAALGLLLRARRDSASGIFQRRVRRVREVPKKRRSKKGEKGGGEEDEALPPEPLRAAKTGEYGTQCQSPEGPGTVVGPVFNFFLDRGE